MFPKSRYPFSEKDMRDVIICLRWRNPPLRDPTPVVAACYSALPHRGDRRMRVIAVLLALAGAGAASVAAAAGPERVDIIPGEGVLYAFLYRPAGPGPFPAVVALHGCSSLAERSGAI